MSEWSMSIDRMLDAFEYAQWMGWVLEAVTLERPDGDTFRYTAPLLTRGPRTLGCDEAEGTRRQCRGRKAKKAPTSGVGG
jgi:hypothetical protein